MLDTAAAETLLDRQTESGYVFPAYEGGSFADIPYSALSLLSSDFDNTLPARVFEGVDTAVDHVVLLVIDGLGWDQFRRDRAEAPFLDRLVERGTVSPLTSIYPSETAAAITSVNTGVTPIEHGLLGWHAYLSEVNESVYTLPFETRAGEAVDEIHPEADGSLLFEADPVYPDADAAGIDTHVLQPTSTAGSTYSRRLFAEATGQTYGTLPSFGVALRQHLTETSGPAYTYAYLPHVDTVAHEVGTDADHYDATISTIGHVLERALVRQFDSTVAERTLLMVTADHGHLNTGPSTRVRLDRDLGGISDHLERGPDGAPIPPQGGPRNLQFHVREGEVEHLRERLETAMPCRTFRRAEYQARGLFGPGDPSAAFERRAPDLVAVHLDSAVWDDPEGLQHVGVHGGMSRSEMLIPLATCRLDTLQS
jgi:hypothetical protein